MSAHSAFRSMRARLAVVSALAAMSLLASTAVGALASSEQSQVKFAATQAEVELDGEFRKFTADIDFDPTRLGSAKVDIAIDLSSVDTGSGDADALLKGKGFFDVAHFPRASFTSASIKAVAPGKYLASGKLTLKGVSADLVVPFAARSDGAGTWFEGALPVSRRAYKVGEGEWADTGTLSDKVDVLFKLYVRR
jgi:polyisoprenoid-binding protein YceI